MLYLSDVLRISHCIGSNDKGRKADKSHNANNFGGLTEESEFYRYHKQAVGRETRHFYHKVIESLN